MTNQTHFNIINEKQFVTIMLDEWINKFFTSFELGDIDPFFITIDSLPFVLNLNYSTNNFHFPLLFICCLMMPKPHILMIYQPQMAIGLGKIIFSFTHIWTRYACDLDTWTNDLILSVQSLKINSRSLS